MHFLIPKPALSINNLHDGDDFISNTLGAKILAYPDPSHCFHLSGYRHQLPTSDLWSCSYGAPITIGFLEGDYFRIQLQQKGYGSTKMGSNEFEVTEKQGVVSDVEAQIHFGHNYEQKVIRINKGSLTKKIVAFTGSALPCPLEFEPAFDCLGVKFQIFKKVHDFIENLLSPALAPLPPMILAELEQTLIVTMLTSFNSNYTSLLERQSLQAAPWQVRHVEAYIEANWDQPIMIENIVKISGCSARSIFRAFQQSRGYSPMMFAKKIRLQRAREMLLTGNEKTITGVAIFCGFPDLGRFSCDYAKAFGELPSVTLKASQSHLNR